MKDIDLLAGLPADDAEKLRKGESDARQLVAQLEANLKQVRNDDRLSTEQKVSRSQQIVAQLQKLSSN